MKNKKGLNFIFLIVVIIVGTALYKQFDFENLKFEKPALAVVYFITFSASVYLLIRDYAKRSKE